MKKFEQLRLGGLKRVKGPLAAVILAAGMARGDDTSLRVFSVNPDALARTKTLLAEGEKSVRPAFQQLLKEAGQALKVKPLSVMDKPKAGASGDKHDYFSTAPYFWPDPATEDGRPYLRKDGRVNPESHNEFSDSPRLSRMANTSETLALAFYFTGNETYAEHAARLLRVFFLDAATRMNPNFDFAQAIPGVNTGRGTGMIESRNLTSACEAAGLLAESKHWSKADQNGMLAWMRAFLDWAQTSKNGKAERAAKNNHGTYYDMQITHLALFVGETNLAKQIVEAAQERRIAAQIKPDGSQPLELERADSFGYSRFNLVALFELATLARRADVDLWQFKTADGAGIRQALDFLMPYVEQPAKKWPYPSSKAGRRALDPVLRQAHAIYGDERYLKLLQKSAGHDRQRDVLFFPH